MGCDHLTVDTFKGSMQQINGHYQSMRVAYTGDLTRAFENMKKAWNTPKGWERVQKLATSLGNNLRSCGRSIEQNYTEMDNSGTKWAQEQHVWFFNCPPVNTYTWTAFDAGKHDGQLNEVKREEVISAATDIKNALQKIFDGLNNMEKVTKSDDAFGYYSTAGNNPRESLNSTLLSKETAMETAFQGYMTNINSDIDADNAARDAALQTEMEDNSTWDLDN